MSLLDTLTIASANLCSALFTRQLSHTCQIFLQTYATRNWKFRLVYVGQILLKNLAT